jgi:hypothetical protein
MLFVEFRFFWFFLAVFAVYWSLRRNDSRKLWLLVCSYFFYACWNWKFLFLIMASSGLDYLVGTMLARTENPRARRGWLILSLTANLGTIAFFKYYNFFVTSAAALLAWLGLHPSLHTLNIIIPVGVSFYTFHSMSYTIDVYRRKLKPVSSILDLACFIGFFPQMVAGPIVRRMIGMPMPSDAVFAAGDVRHGSMKRVAAAVGEGASAVRSVHVAIGAPRMNLVGRPQESLPDPMPAAGTAPMPREPSSQLVMPGGRTPAPSDATEP